MATELITAQAQLPRAAPAGFTDYVFKSVHGINLSLRIWPANVGLMAIVRSPFVIWTHGGSFLVGKHYPPLVWLEPGLRARGYHIVPHSYRLSPQTRIDESLSCCIDAVIWYRVNLPKV
jgi:acetyl esterase/lipase